MTITVRWDDPEQTITYMTFTGALHVDDLFATWQEELTMQTSVAHPVYSLNDLTAAQPVLRGLNLRRMVQFIQQNQAPNLQMTVQVASSCAIRYSLQMIAKLMPHEVHIVETLEAAYAIIEADKVAFRQRLVS
jgi:hypothetical protein